MSTLSDYSLITLLNGIGICFVNKFQFEFVLYSQVHTGSVDQLRWHPTKPETLVTASGDKTVRVWDTRGGQGVGEF